MSKSARIFNALLVPGLLTAALAIVFLWLRAVPVSAHVVPSPCDFTTGGGYVLTDSGNNANFGLVAGCKNGGFYGHFNFVDHDTSGSFAGLHVSSDSITGYFDACISGCGNPPQYRDICGTADTNLFGPVYFRARTYDGGQPSGPPGTNPDRFGLKLANDSGSAVVVSTRELMGGNLTLHKPNPSNTGPNPPPDEFSACHMDDSGLGN